MKKLFAFIVVLSVCGCEIPESLKTLSEDQTKDLAIFSDELEEQAEKLSACTHDSDCIVSGFNPMSCGGYSNFLVASQVSDKTGTLQSSRPSKDYVEFINRLRVYQSRAAKEQEGQIGICPWIEAPRGRCTENKCTSQSYQEFSPDLIDNNQ